MALNKSSKLLNFINARMRVTIQDSRVLVGTFMAFDKHMNLVLGDCEEFRRIRIKKAGGGLEEREDKRLLGLVLLRGENVVSIQIESMPRAPKQGAPGTSVGAATAAGRGSAPVPPAMAPPVGLAGPVRGIGGPAPAGMMPPGVFPGGMPPGMPPGFPPAGMPLPPGVMPPRPGMMPPPGFPGMMPRPPMPGGMPGGMGMPPRG